MRGSRQLIAPERFGLYDRLIFALFVLVLPPIVATTPRLFGDGDVSWHIAAGRWILEHGRVPATDPFSFSMAGKPWVAHEWLAEVVYAGAFDLAGHAGLAAVVTIAVMALNAIVFLHLRPRVGPVGLLVALLAMDIILRPFFYARPHVLVWPLLAFWAAALLSARDRGRPPPLWLALAMLVWANLHGSFLLGFAVAGVIGLDAWAKSGWSRSTFLGWLTFGLAALLASLVNANGLAAFTHPIAIMGMESLSRIAEWLPSTPGRYPYFYIVLLPTLAAILTKGVRLRWGDTLLLLILLLMAFTQVRHQTWLAIIGTLVLAPGIAFPREGSEPLFGWSKPRRAWTVVAAVLALAIVVGRAALPIQPREGDRYPYGMIAAIPPELRDEPVLNGYSFGGPLILAGVRPYIDGRADMYGDEFTLDYLQITDGDERRFRAAVKRHGIRWTFLPNGTPLLEYLDASPDWRRLYADDRGVIHVRRRAPPQDPARD